MCTLALSPGPLSQLFQCCTQESERRAWFATSQISERGLGRASSWPQNDTMHVHVLLVPF